MVETEFLANYTVFVCLAHIAACLHCDYLGRIAKLHNKCPTDNMHLTIEYVAQMIAVSGEHCDIIVKKCCISAVHRYCVHTKQIEGTPFSCRDHNIKCVRS